MDADSSEAVRLLESIAGGSALTELVVWVLVILLVGVPLIKRIDEGWSYLWGKFVHAVRKANGTETEEEPNEENRRDNSTLLDEVQKMFHTHESTAKASMQSAMKEHNSEMKNELGKIHVEMKNTNTTISKQQENIEKLFERTESDGNRLTAVETTLGTGQ